MVEATTNSMVDQLATVDLLHQMYWDGVASLGTEASRAEAEEVAT